MIIKVKPIQVLVTTCFTLVGIHLMLPSAEADVFGSGANQFNLGFSTIGNTNNTADAVTGYGAVGYAYRMGTHEVTLDQFSKAQAASGDTISNGNESYWNDGTRTVGANGPASQVSWTEAARFSNWLTTGNATLGVYQFDGNGVLTGIDRSYRNGTDQAYMLPSENEWYKAAYYKPIDDNSYSRYANGSDLVGDLTHGTSSGWNYKNAGQMVNIAPNFAWETGFGGEEQNGTFDMMGNVSEWTDSAFDGSTNNMAAARTFLGGSAFDSESALRSTSRSSLSLSSEFNDLGFRVVSIPEPLSLTMLGLAAGVGFFIRKYFMV